MNKSVVVVLVFLAGCGAGGPDLAKLKLQATLNPPDVMGTYGVTVSGGRAYVNTTYGAMVVAIDNGTDARVLGTYESMPRVFDRGRATAVRGTTFFSGHSSRVDMVDVSDPAQLKQVARIDGTGLVRDLELVGTTLYVVDESAGVLAYDVSDPAAPKLTGTVRPGAAYAVAATATHVFIAGSGDLVAVEVSGGGYQTVSTTPFGFSGFADLELAGNALLISSPVLMAVYDVSKPSSPVVVLSGQGGVLADTGPVTAPGSGAGTALVGGRWYATRDVGTVAVLDVRGTEVKGLGNVPGTTEPPVGALAYDVAADEQRVYLAHANGLLVYGP